MEHHNTVSVAQTLSRLIDEAQEDHPLHVEDALTGEDLARVVEVSAELWTRDRNGEVRSSFKITLDDGAEYSVAVTKLP